MRIRHASAPKNVGIGRRRVVVLFVLALALPLALASTAQAGYGLAGYFGEEGQGAGQFNFARGLTVNETGAGSGAEAGDVYVLDGSSEQRIQQFHANGAFVRMWGWGVQDGSDEFQHCTVGCHAPVYPSVPGGAGAINFANGIAVDQGTGNVYVADGNNSRVDVFNSEGNFEGAFGFGVINGNSAFQFCTTVCTVGIAGGGAGQFDEPSSVSVDPTSGAIYVADGRNHRVNKFSLTLNGSEEVTGATFVNAFGWGVAGSGDPGDTAPVNQFEVCTTVCLTGIEGYGVGQFGQFAPSSVAVNSAGIIYTAEDGPEGRAQQFVPSGGTYTPSVFAPTVTRPRQIAVGAGDHVFFTREFQEGATPECPNGSPSFFEYRVIEVDGSGAVQGSEAGMTCARVSSYFGLTVNKSTGELYIPSYDYSGPEIPVRGVRILTESQLPTATIDDITPTTSGAVVSGTVNPNGPPTSIPHPVTTSYQLQYKLTSSSVWTSFGSPIDIGAGLTSIPVTVNLGGLEGNTPYEIRLAATRPLGLPSSYSAPETFTTSPTPPSIESSSSSSVTVDSADLHGLVNPHGADTTVHFEYGTTPSYGQRTPDVDIGNALTAQPVQAHIEGLDPVVYHFRLIATNATGTTFSPDQTLTFYPPQCPNSTIRQQTGSQYLPDCRAYELVSPEFAGNVVLIRPEYPLPYATSPARFIFGGIQGAVGGGLDTQSANVADKYISTRTNTGWVTTFAGLRGSEVLQSNGIYPSITGDRIIDFKEQPESVPYVWDVNGNPLGRWPADATTIPNGDIGTHRAWQPSPDFSHLAFSSRDVSYDPAHEGLTVAPGSAYDYDTSADTTTIISKTPAGADIPNEPTNSNENEFIRFPGADAPDEPAKINPGVSVDGSHILMSVRREPEFGSPVHLYMRVDDSATYDVSQGHTVDYLGMTKDGSKVLFTTDDPLITATDQDTDTSTDLYMWSEDTDSLTRISIGSGGTGNTDSCVSPWTTKCGIRTIEGQRISDYAVANRSGDVLFYSPELLDGPANGLEGAQNLYLYHDGNVRFVAQLTSSGSDPATRVQISPDGEHAAFVTRSRLTSYDNDGFAEMYSYETDSGELRCVSCDPTGAPPAADVQGSTGGLFMSDDGRTFWSTSDALVPYDTNKLIDVYEFVDGRPQLITSGTADKDDGGRVTAGLNGVSADGINVYFTTFDSLVVQDRNGPYGKFYDARTNGGFVPPPIELPCVAADECHGETNPAPPPPRVVSNGDLGAGGNVSQKAAKKNNKGGKKGKKHKKRRARHRGGRG